MTFGMPGICIFESSVGVGVGVGGTKKGGLDLEGVNVNVHSRRTKECHTHCQFDLAARFRHYDLYVIYM